MHVIIGSKNKAKISAVRSVFPNETIMSMDVPSNVSSQPLTDEETKAGAINRAKQCALSQPNAIGIGLEGGVMYIGKKLFLCNWGALVSGDHNIYTASGARISLPSQLAEGLENGEELGDLIDDYVQKKDIRNNEGTIGIFTNDLISRKEMFAHVVTLLRGQWEYWE